MSSFSYFSGTSVITIESGLYKRVVISTLLRPKFSILNPELSLTFPINQTMIGIANITTHMIECYFTQEPHVEPTIDLQGNKKIENKLLISCFCPDLETPLLYHTKPLCRKEDKILLLNKP